MILDFFIAMVLWWACRLYLLTLSGAVIFTYIQKFSQEAQHSYFLFYVMISKKSFNICESHIVRSWVILKFIHVFNYLSLLL